MEVLVLIHLVGGPPPILHFPPKLGRVNIVFARMRRVRTHFSYAKVYEKKT